MTSACDHVARDIGVGAPLDICTDCLAIGGTWVHLRQCLTCGRTSCCDLSPHRHATAHFRSTGHPMIRSAEPDEAWQWCFEDLRLYEPDAVAR